MASSIREIGENIKNSAFFKGSVLYDEPLAPRTTMKVGGASSLFVEPSDTTSLALALKQVSSGGIDYFVLGGGSNIVVSDTGFAGAVISTLSLTELTVSTAEGAAVTREGAGPYAEGAALTLTAGAGLSTDTLVRFCAEHGFTGMECFASLPGTLGGAAYMNARCYEHNISDFIVSVSYLDADDSFAQKTLSSDKSLWAYKHSPFTDKKNLITQVTFALSFADGINVAEYKKTPAQEIPFAPTDIKNSLLKKCSFYEEDRIKKGHFKFPSAGSVFKNNRSFGKPSGQLIDECGLKGSTLGGAQIAPWHANIIINTGSATADDIKALVQKTRETVAKKTGFTLESEIVFY